MKKGFTLAETLVAVGLFSIIVTIAVGGFVNALRAQRQVAALIAAQSNASLALEQMAREIRTGYLFCHDEPIPPDTRGVPTCPLCTVNGPVWTCPNFLQFHSAAGVSTTYSLANGALQRAEENQNGGAPQPITGADVAVNYLSFTLFGNLEGDHWNPRITISIGVAPSSTDPAVASTILYLQTTVSARQIDCAASGTISISC